MAVLNTTRALKMGTADPFGLGSYANVQNSPHSLVLSNDSMNFTSFYYLGDPANVDSFQTNANGFQVLTYTNGTANNFSTILADITAKDYAPVAALLLAGNDAITGSVLNDVLIGYAGNDTIQGNSGKDKLLGAGGRDTLFGQDGDDRILGGNGADYISGGKGHDTLTGGASSDKFLVGETGDASIDTVLNIDTITDFTHGTDKLLVGQGEFHMLATGALPASMFALGNASSNPAAVLVYDFSTGTLYDNADGTGPGAPIAILHITPGTVLSAGDFLVV